MQGFLRAMSSETEKYSCPLRRTARRVARRAACL